MNARDAEAYERTERWLEVPMAALAVILGVLLLIPAMVEVSAETETTLDLFGWMIWALFVFEYLLLLWLAPDRVEMVKRHPIELILILLPILRPLRALRLLRVFTGVAAGFATVHALLHRRGLQWFSLFVLVLIGLGACFTYSFERHVDDAQITTIGEALWWALVTCTTVGYGDFAPVSAGGRGVAVFLMLVGVSVYSVVTANIASYFVEQEVEEDTLRLEAQLAEIQGKLDALLAER